jgi:hypothetical protein
MRNRASQSSRSAETPSSRRAAIHSAASAGTPAGMATTVGECDTPSLERVTALGCFVRTTEGWNSRVAGLAARRLTISQRTGRRGQIVRLYTITDYK